MDEFYEDVLESDFDEGLDDGLDYEDDGDEDDDDESSEYEEMLEALMDEDDDDEGEYPELFGRRRRRRARAKGRRARAKNVRTAGGRSAFRGKLASGYVNQKQFKAALARVGRDTRRNALGIKTVNKRVGKVNTRVDGVTAVNRVQSKHIGKMKQQMKSSAILEFVESYDGSSIDTFQLLKGAVASGYVGTGKGALANPLLIGGVGLLLRNPSILSGVLSPATP